MSNAVTVTVRMIVSKPTSPADAVRRMVRSLRGAKGAEFVVQDDGRGAAYGVKGRVVGGAFRPSASPRLLSNPHISDIRYRDAAKEGFHREGEIEVDDNAPVSWGNDDGAYVQAWVWVPDESVPPTLAGKESA